MLPIDPGDGPGSPLPGGPPPALPEGNNGSIVAAVPARALTDIVPPQAMARGGTIIRPGAVAWGGPPDARGGGYSSCEAIERALAAVTRNPGQLPGLLAELALARLWVPLPAARRPFTDGAAVRLPLIGYQGDDFVPCFTSVQRLAGWTAPAGPPADGAVTAAGPGGAGRAVGRPWQRAGDPRLVPHIVLPAAGLAARLPAGLGLAVNPDCVPGLPLYPECVPYLARRPAPAMAAAYVPGPRDDLAEVYLAPGGGPRFLIGHPPAEPAALLAAARAALRALPSARRAARAWLSVPGRGEGLLISVVLGDPASEQARAAAAEAIERAAAAVPLRVPFPVDLTFPGEPEAPGQDGAGPDGRHSGALSPPDAIDAWIADNTRPFYLRD